MNGVTAFALFCDDVRRERSGKDTLIGVMSDTLTVPHFPGRPKRLAVYFRVRLETGKQYSDPIQIELEVPGVEIRADKTGHPGPIPTDIIERALKSATERGSPYASILGKMDFDELPLFPEPVTLKALLRVGGQTQICGILNIALSKSASNATPPPASQSPPAAPST